MNAIINISPNGTIKCIWNEALPLPTLGEALGGKLEVKRASNVEFNAQTQQWEVRLADDPERVAFSHPSRAHCIEWEVDLLNDQLALGIGVSRL